MVEYPADETDLTAEQMDEITANGEEVELVTTAPQGLLFSFNNGVPTSTLGAAQMTNPGGPLSVASNRVSGRSEPVR